MSRFTLVGMVETAVKPRFCWWEHSLVNCSPRGGMSPVVLHLLRMAPFVFFTKLPHVLMLAHGPSLGP